jgi:hypothetical protein
MKLRLIFALLLLAGALVTSTRVSAVGGSYTCRGSHTTATATGTGGSCTAAQASLTSILDNYAQTDCYSDLYSDHACAVKVIDTAACTCSGAVCHQTGYATHSCADCGYPGGPICP